MATSVHNHAFPPRLEGNGPQSVVMPSRAVASCFFKNTVQTRTLTHVHTHSYERMHAHPIPIGRLAADGNVAYHRMNKAVKSWNKNWCSSLAFNLCTNSVQYYQCWGTRPRLSEAGLKTQPTTYSGDLYVILEFFGRKYANDHPI